MSFLSSFGLKRYIASALTSLAGIIASDPNLAPALPIVVYLASFFGVTGLVGAAKEGTLGKNKLTSLSSLFALLIALTDAHESLQPWKPLLLLVGSFLGISAVTVTPKPDKKS